MASQRATQFAERFQQLSALVWYKFCSLQITGALLATLVVVFILGLLIPQQPTADMPAEIWIALLPTWLQPWGEPLYLVGFSRIFQSPWFWVPVALLLFHSLIVLADYAVPSWKRTQAAKDTTSLEWQHPLSQRVEHSVRLPASPDKFLDELKESLAAKGFLIDPPFTNEERVVSAAQRRYIWFGVLTFYGSLALLCFAFLLSHYYMNTESQTLVPFEAQPSQLFDGTFELVEVNADARSGSIVFTPKASEQAHQTLAWQLYFPKLFDMAVVWPVAMEPIVSVEAQDSTGHSNTLIPLQEDLPPTTRLNLPLDQTEPFYFLIPKDSLAFQVSSVPASSEGDYNVQVRRRSESSPSENLMVNLGEAFEIDSYSVTISLDHNLKLIARRDWPLLLLFMLIIVVVMVSAGLLFFSSPWQVWLVPEVKGRGGQLYGVVEKFGSAKGVNEFLEHLLATKDSPQQEQETQL